jgi:hypothetical protein
MERWDALYYCWRDDSVFIPGIEVAMPVEELWDFSFGLAEPETT